MEEDFFVEFYDDELNLPPDEFKELLYELHLEYNLEDVTNLLKHFEEVENYELCRVVKDFQDDELKK